MTQACNNSVNIDQLLQENPEISSQPGKNAQAYLLHRSLSVPRKTIAESKFASHAGISRAKKCFQLGYDPCHNGRHQKLSNFDEMTLVSWVIELLDNEETVTTNRLMELVYDCI